MKGAYAKLIRVAETRQAQARRVCMALRGGSEGAAQRLVGQFEAFLPRNDQAITQTVRRVIDGEVVSAKEKIASLFEPHTQIILRHKVGKAGEFGRKLWVEEVEGGIISGYRVLEEPGQDDAYFARRLTAHQRRFGKAPYLVAGDRGSPRPRMSAWPPRWKSSELCSLGMAKDRRSCARTNGSSGFGEAVDFGPRSKGGSASCGVIVGSRAVRITARTGCNAT